MAPYTAFAIAHGKTGAGNEGSMTLESFYPMLLAADVGARAHLYTEHRGFAPSFESDWCVSLGHGENHTYE
jgi:hypothetical protein